MLNKVKNNNNNNDDETFLLIYGTYDKCIFAIEYTLSSSSLSSSYEFTTDAHDGLVKCLSLSNTHEWLVSGGSDETIHIYNIDKRMDYGKLYGHQGSINAIEFYNNTHLFSASDDGTIRIWSVKDNWNEIKTLRNNKNPSSIRDISIHPSGKIALSIHANNRLCVWNLLRGILVLTTNLKKNSNIIQWSPNGDYYAIVSDSTKQPPTVFPNTLVTIFTQEGETHAWLEHEQKILCMLYLNNDYIACGCENGNIYVWNIQKKKCIGRMEAHKTRVRSIKHVNSTTLISISTDGMISFWNISLDDDDGDIRVYKPVDTYETNQRATSLCVLLKKKNDDDVDETHEQSRNKKRTIDDTTTTSIPRQKKKKRNNNKKKKKKRRKKLASSSK